MTNEIKFFLSPSGDDSADGRLDSPLKTLDGVKKPLCKAVNDGFRDITIELAPGMYDGRSGFRITEHELPDGVSLTLRSTPDKSGARAMLNGGRDVSQLAYPAQSGDGVDQALLARLERDVRDRVTAVDFTGLERFAPDIGDDVNPVRIYAGETALEAARWPNRAGETARDGKYLFTDYIEHLGEDYKNADFKVSFGDEVRERAKRWAASDGIMIFGYLWHNWYTNRYKVDSFDFENGSFLVKGGTKSYKFEAWDVKPRRYFFMNVAEELDSPSEYYYDRDNARLYFIASPEWDHRLTVSDSAEPLVSLSGVSRVTIENIDFEYCRKSAVAVENCSDILLRGCKIAHTSLDAAELKNCRDSRVDGLDIFDTACGGIILNHCGDRHELTPANVTVENCVVRSVTAVRKCYVPSIGASECCGVVIRNCEMSDSPHALMPLGANCDLAIENNLLRGACRDTDDCAAIYWGRYPASLGVRITGNRFIDIGNREAEWSTAAIYTDDYGTGPEITGNLFVNCGLISSSKRGPRSGSHAVDLNCAQYVTIRGNVFVCADPDEKPVKLSVTDCVLNWAAFMCDKETALCGEHYKWRHFLTDSGFLTDRWREHYKNTAWESIWDTAGDDLFEAAGKLGDDPFVVRAFMLDRFWDHKTEAGDAYPGGAVGYITGAYPARFDKYKDDPPLTAALKIASELVWEGKMTLRSSNAFENNVVVGIDRSYLTSGGKLPACGMNGSQNNFISPEFTLTLPTGERTKIFGGEDENLRFTPRAAEIIHQTLPDFKFPDFMKA